MTHDATDKREMRPELRPEPIPVLGDVAGVGGMNGAYTIIRWRISNGGRVVGPGSDRMRVLLVHHADAVGAGVDTQRPLSSLGRRQADELAKAAATIGFAPAAIWHSGKLRSRETAEAFLRACAPFAQFKMIRGLLPDDPPEWLRDELAAEDRDVLLVGHMPHIARLAALLSGGAIAMPLHGTVGFEKSEDGTWTIFSDPRSPVRS